VFDVASAQAVDEKQIFIKPQQGQPLTPECQHETGITDAMLEGAGTLQACIQVCFLHCHSKFFDEIELSFHLVRSLFSVWRKKFCIVFGEGIFRFCFSYQVLLNRVF
jgi:hypothetical protein